LVIGDHAAVNAFQGDDRLLLLPADRRPAEVRVFERSFLLIDRDLFRGAAPAGADRIRALDPNGRITFERGPGLDIAGAHQANLLDATVTATGQIVASMVALRAGSADVHVLLFYTPGSAAPTVVVTAPVACVKLTPAVAGGVWCLGPDVVKHNAGRRDFRFLHAFTEEGRLERSIGARADFTGVRRPWEGDAQLAAHGNTVVVWMGALRELVTFNEGGEILSRQLVEGPPGVDARRVPYWLASDGRLFSTVVTSQPTEQRGTWRQEILTLVSAGPWRSTGLTSVPAAVTLVGGRPQALVLWDRDAGRLIFASAPRQ
jgi:hypothetical protein